MHVNPRTGGWGTNLGHSLLNHKQLEGFLQAPVWSTGNPPCLTPPPTVSATDSWSVEQVIFCFSVKQGG